MAMFRSFRALLWRNAIYRKRRWIASIFEFCLPIIMVGLLVWIKSAVENTAGFKPTIEPPRLFSSDDTYAPVSFADYVTALNAERVCVNIEDEEFDYTGISGIVAREWTIPVVQCDERQCENLDTGTDATEFCEYRIMAFAPSDGNDPALLAAVQNFTGWIEETHPAIATAPAGYDFLKIFPNGESIDAYVKSREYGGSGSPKIAVAVLFSSVSPSYGYTIRVNSTNFNSPSFQGQPTAKTTPDTEILLDTFAKNPNEPCSGEGQGTPYLAGNNARTCTGWYFNNGALTMQRLVDDWIIYDSGAEAGGSKVAETGVYFVDFPTPEFVRQGFYGAISTFAPLIIVIGLLYPVANGIRIIVEEKQLRQKELMKMMSVTESVIGWSWTVSLYAFFFFPGLICAVLSDILYEQSEFAILFVFWQLTFIACIMFIQAISAFFSQATRGTLVGIMVFFMGYFLSLAASFQSGSAQLISLLSLHPVTAFTYGLQTIGGLEDSGVGVTFNTLGYSDYPSGYTFANTLTSLLLDIFLWGVLSWYLNRVVNGEYGRAHPLHFPFTKAYWFGKKGSSKENLPVGGECEPIGVDRTLVMEPVSEALRKQDAEGKSVEIRNLKKLYGDKTAVDGLTLSMYTGQVTCLLGHNGAGKTTTINMLTGMVSPSSGYAVVAGNDTRTDITQLRENVGICLQHDCLFPLLTVKEHVQFFAMIKGTYENKTKEEADASIIKSIEDVALLEKRETMSKDLSGGMKRKLSVAIAFCGDSKVVFLDEPTSGMDPFSRRFTWNVIRQYRQDRCIILTTHFMDEADLLGDRIAIMSEGRLCCVGSSLFLKKSFGVGYQLSIEKRSSTNKISKSASKDNLQTTDNVTNNDEARASLSPSDKILYDIVITSAVPEGKILSNVGTEMSFQLPIDASEKFPNMFEGLDRQVETGLIVTYGVSITTLDEVFLMVARGETGRHEQMDSVVKHPSLRPNGKEGSIIVDSAVSLDGVKSYRSTLTDERDGAIFSRHVQALFTKRALNFKRDRKAWFCSTVLPSILAMFGFLVVKFTGGSQNMPSLTLTLDAYNPDVSLSGKAPQNPIPYNTGPSVFECLPGRCIMSNDHWDISLTGEEYFYCGKSGSVDNSSFANCTIRSSDDIAATIEGNIPIDVANVYETSVSLSNMTNSYMSTIYGALYFSRDMTSTIVENNNASYSEASYQACAEKPGDYRTTDQCNNFRGISYVVSTNFTSPHSSILYQAVADEAIVREATNNPDITITPTIHPLPITALEVELSGAQDAFLAWFVIIFSFPFIMGSFATFIVAERKSKAKHLQTVAGVQPSAYWFSSYLWDVMNYQLPLWIVVILLFAIGIEPFTTTDKGVVGGTIVTLFLFGPAAAGFTYCVTFLFDSPSTCNFSVIVGNLMIGLVGSLTSFILRIVSDGDFDGKIWRAANIVDRVLRIFPSFNLCKGLLYELNIDFLAFVYNKPDMTVWSYEVLGIEIICLAVQSVVYVLLAIQLDKLSTKPRVMNVWEKAKNISSLKFMRDGYKQCRSSSDDDCDNATDTITAKDEDVAAEEERVQCGGADDDLIILKNLTKMYNNGKKAVNDLSFGIPKGECFGLLGINGAGKTTTMAMLTAEFPPTSGDAVLGSYSVTGEPEKTRRRIGYCPQFDAHFANMSGRENVELYASIKGIPKDIIEEAAAAKLREVGLNDYDSNRLSSEYSGGMKRKLSVACATIGQPEIVFLDEPSTGMDPVARRDLWGVISNMVKANEDHEFRTSVILTTHSMEECEALCPRIGIMAGGRLRCMGSAQWLKTKFGKGYQVEMKVEEVDQSDERYQSTLASLLSQVGVSAGAVEGDITVKAGNTPINLEQTLRAVRSLTDNDFLSSKITPDDPTGYAVYKDATSDVGISADELAAFCVDELRVKHLIEFIQETYPGAIMRERQDHKVRFEIGSEGLKVSSIFTTIEESKQDLRLADYGISQTSLEQVFNMHAAEAEQAKHNTIDS